MPRAYPTHLSALKDVRLFMVICPFSCLWGCLDLLLTFSRTKRSRTTIKNGFPREDSSFRWPASWNIYPFSNSPTERISIIPSSSSTDKMSASSLQHGVLTRSHIKSSPSRTIDQEACQTFSEPGSATQENTSHDSASNNASSVYVYPPSAKSLMTGDWSKNECWFCEKRTPTHCCHVIAPHNYMVWPY